MQGIIFVYLVAFFYQTFAASTNKDISGQMVLKKRQKRSTEEECLQSLFPKSHVQMPECCSMPNILANTDRVWDTCIEKRNNTMDKPHPPPPDHKENGKGHGPPCLFQCVFINSGLADQDGKLDEQKVSSKISEVLKGDPKWGSFEWQQSLNKCFSEIKNLKEEQNNHMDTPSGRLMKCFLRDLYLNCPYNAWVESSECTSQKSLVQNCPMLPPPVLKHGPPKKN